MTWDPPEPGTHFGKTGRGPLLSQYSWAEIARIEHGHAAREYRLWRSGFWVGFNAGFDAAYKYVDPEA